MKHYFRIEMDESDTDNILLDVAGSKTAIIAGLIEVMEKDRNVQAIILSASASYCAINDYNWSVLFDIVKQFHDENRLTVSKLKKKTK